MDYYLIFRIAILFIFLFFSIPTMIGFSNGAGPLITPEENIRESLKYIKIRPKDKIYDLGCGIGRILIIGAKEFRADVFGFEMSPILYFIAKINLYIQGVKKFKLKRVNFYKESLSQANIVYCFLSIKDMEKLKNKLERELKIGAWVISFAFPIEGWKAEKIFNFDNPGKMYLYKKD